ncbi:TIGR00341 family protein [Natronospora cellulosivora (SeqCode)]
MQIVHATFRAGEGEEAVDLLSTLGVDIEDYKLIKSESGDLLIINLLYGDTDVLLDNMKSRFDFENDKERSMVIFTPDTVIPRNIEKIQKAEFRASRESLITFAEDKSEVNSHYVLLVFFSAVIATLGLILDNVAVIVGAMVIAPVLGPLLALTIGIMLADFRLIRQGVAAEILAITIAITVGAFFALFLPEAELSNSLYVRMYPNIGDLFIALAAGAAGAYSLIRNQLESGLIGVMVAAALIPVMATIGVGVGLGFTEMVWGAGLLLLVNLLSILLANIIVFYFKGLKPQLWYKYKAKKLIKKSLSLVIIAIILISIPLALITTYQFYVQKPVEIIKDIVREGLVLDYRIDRISVEGNLVEVYLYANHEINKDRLTEVKKEIESELDKEYTINFKFIPIQQISL